MKKVVIIIIALLLVAGGGVGLLWWIGGQNLQTKDSSAGLSVTASSSKTFLPPSEWQFKRGDLSISNQETTQSLETYRDLVSESIKIFAQNQATPTPELLVHYLSVQDQQSLSDLALASRNHLALLQILHSATVPASASTIHLELLNRLAHTAELCYYMSQADKEPQIALEAGREYPTSYMAFLYQLTVLKKYFTDHHLDFSFQYPSLLPLN